MNTFKNMAISNARSSVMCRARMCHTLDSSHAISFLRTELTLILICIYRSATLYIVQREQTVLNE